MDLKLWAGDKVLRNAFGIWNEIGGSRLGVIGLVILKGIVEGLCKAVKATTIDGGDNE